MAYHKFTKVNHGPKCELLHATDAVLLGGFKCSCPIDEWGSFETFHIGKDEMFRTEPVPGGEPKRVSEYKPGWYWWACFPGCLPDSDPTGPFKTEEEAVKDAQEEE